MLVGLLEFTSELDTKREGNPASSVRFVKKQWGWPTGSAEGARVEVQQAPMVVGMGYPPPQPTRGSGERRELPQWGPGGAGPQTRF